MRAPGSSANGSGTNRSAVRRGRRQYPRATFAPADEEPPGTPIGVVRPALVEHVELGVRDRPPDGHRAVAAAGPVAHRAADVTGHLRRAVEVHEAAVRHELVEPPGELRRKGLTAREPRPRGGAARGPTSRPLSSTACSCDGTIRTRVAPHAASRSTSSTRVAGGSLGHDHRRHAGEQRSHDLPDGVDEAQRRLVHHHVVGPNGNSSHIHDRRLCDGRLLGHDRLRTSRRARRVDRGTSRCRAVRALRPRCQARRGGGASACSSRSSTSTTGDRGVQPLGAESTGRDDRCRAAVGQHVAGQLVGMVGVDAHPGGAELDTASMAATASIERWRRIATTSPPPTPAARRRAPVRSPRPASSRVGRRRRRRSATPARRATGRPARRTRAMDRARPVPLTARSGADGPRTSAQLGGRRQRQRGDRDGRGGLRGPAGRRRGDAPAAPRSPVEQLGAVLELAADRPARRPTGAGRGRRPPSSRGTVRAPGNPPAPASTGSKNWNITWNSGLRPRSRTGWSSSTSRSNGTSWWP